LNLRSTFLFFGGIFLGGQIQKSGKNENNLYLKIGTFEI